MQTKTASLGTNIQRQKIQWNKKYNQNAKKKKETQNMRKYILIRNSQYLQDIGNRIQETRKYK